MVLYEGKVTSGKHEYRKHGDNCGSRLLNRQPVMVVVAIIIFFFSAYICFIFGSESGIGVDYDTKRDTGVEFSLKRKLAFENERTFTGDGDSIIVYELDEETAKLFENPPSQFFAEYPKFEGRGEYAEQHWKRSPVGNEEIRVLVHALREIPYLMVGSKVELEKLLRYVKHALKVKGAYYSFRYFKEETVENFDSSYMDFYVLVPRDRLYIYINRKIVTTHSSRQKKGQPRCFSTGP